MEVRALPGHRQRDPAAGEAEKPVAYVRLQDRDSKLHAGHGHRTETPSNFQKAFLHLLILA